MLSLHDILHILLTIVWIVQLSDFKTVSASTNYLNLNPLQTFIQVKNWDKTNMPKEHADIYGKALYRVKFMLQQTYGGVISYIFRGK